MSYLVPYGYPQPDTRPQLDRLISQMRAYDPRPWGARPVVLPCAAFVVLIAAGQLVGHLIRPRTFAGALALTIALNLVLYGVLVAVIRYAGRDLVARFAGWGWTFGLQRPKWMDAAWVAAGFGMAMLGRLVVGVLANAATHGTALKQSQNLDVHTSSVTVYVVLGVIVVLIAPLIEETVFRGLLLRTFMQRLGFWPAALLSSAIFAIFHTYEVSTLAGAVTLAGVVFTLGLTNCLLVRWSGRLAAGMVVHALFNGLAVLVLILTN